MTDVAVRVEHVWKKFHRGQLHDSLRDLIPALAGKFFSYSSNKANAGREFWALQDVSFEVKKGEAFGIVGPNGAGKSTMLKLLGRLMKPTRGLIHVNGRLSALIELAAGFHPDLTGRENIYLYGTILGMTRREISAKFDDIVDFSGLEEEFIDTPVKRYSSGMSARLGFSIATYVNPDVLLVDEVLSVGDVAFQQKCVDRMKKVIRDGPAILFVSHDLKTVTEFCHRCLLLDHGRAVAIGPTEEVIRCYLTSLNTVHARDDSSPLFISKVRIRNEDGECVQFTAGQTAWLDIEVTARERCTKLSVFLWILDSTYREIFNTSTERLGHGNFTLDRDEVFVCTIKLTLNLANGTFYPYVGVYRYDTETMYDAWLPTSSTIYISSEQDVQGAVHCFPQVLCQEIQKPSSMSSQSDNYHLGRNATKLAVVAKNSGGGS